MKSNILKISPVIKIDNNINKLKNIPKYGIYIWGFKFNQGKDPFIPYYVGRAMGSTIKGRLKNHYFFEANYHVIKSEYLNNFNEFLMLQNELNNIVDDNVFNIYKEHFDYLNNIKEILKKPKTLAPRNSDFNSLKNYRKSMISKKNNTLEESINNYQNNFYACWIEVNEVDKEKRKKIITYLEKFVNNIIISKGYKIVGKKLNCKDNDVVIDFNFVNDFNFLNK